MRNQEKLKAFKAFSLVNVMIAIVIAGLIAAVAVPSYMESVIKAKQLEADIQLQHIYSLQDLYRMEYSKYSTDIKEIGYKQQTLVTEGGTARYKIDIVDATNTTFTASATSVEDFDGDGVFNVWEINQDKKITEVVED